MATLSTNQTGASPEYLRYSYGSITKTDRASDPVLLDFRTFPSDPNFVKLTRGSYITLNTEQYGIWFTGFITNDAELEYIGSTVVRGAKTPLFGYIYQATSDEYLLNLKPIGIVPPFVNTTQGAVLRFLVDLLSPAGWNFDVSGIRDGQGITRYVIDPTLKFSEVVKVFADAANYQFNATNKVLTYMPQDIALCGIAVDGTSKHFTPSRLTLQPVADPVINDSIILGDIEPQTYFNEYFVGDGATAAFPLVNSVYGVDSTVLLDDDFSDSTIDNTKWTLVDSANTFLQPLNGFLNVLGGSDDGAFDVYLQSQMLIPLEGNLRLTHGEYDFVQASDGIIASLWTQDCSSDLTRCLYGLRLLKSGTDTIVHPILNGVVDTSQSMTIDYTKRYNMRTLFGCTQAMRLTPQRSYRDSNGAIQQLGGTSKPAIGYFQTVITAIDPTNGDIGTQTTFLNSDVTLTEEQTFGYYCPVVDNDLNLTVTGVTISSPMQTNLEIKPAGTGSYLQKLMGPNEIDSFDGQTPVATVIDTDAGSTARSTVLGTPILNNGQATLTFFKDTTRQITQTPQVGDMIHLAYRVPGAAMGRVQNRESLTLEAASFKDDGLRTAVVNDMSPLPRTAEECEQAAAAYVAMYGYQHYQGTYIMPSGPWFSSEPKSGTILKFNNMVGTVAGFPSYLKAEAVTEVITTLDGNISGRSAPPFGYGQASYNTDLFGDNLLQTRTESFTHNLTFGPINKLTQFLGTLKNRTDVFVIQDTAEIPDYVDVSSIGLSNSIDVTSPKLVSWDTANLYFDTGVAAPSGVQFEVRYSDSSWGSTDAGNLVSRVTSGTSFSVPRNNRGKVCFVRAHDTRNIFAWSDDLTKMTATVGGAPLTNAIGKNPENDKGVITTFTPNGSFPYVDWYTGLDPANLNGCWSVSVLGTVGTTFTMSMYFRHGDNSIDPRSPSQTITCTGGWQRLSLPFSWDASFTGTLYYHVAASAPVQLCHASTELGTDKETIYCKTNGSPYGALSRYSAGVRVGLPLPPPPPTATLSFVDENSPVVTVILPTVLQDVWGIEIRGSDNTTVLEHQDLSSVGYAPVVGMPTNSSRNVAFYVYTYNLLGEFSTPYEVSFALPSPSITDLILNNTTKTLTWDSENCTGFTLKIDTVGFDMTHLTVNSTVTDNWYQLSDNDFFEQRWIELTPFDGLGNGGAVEAETSYLPDALTELAANEVAVVVLPIGTAGSTTITVPDNFAQYAGDYIDLAHATYQRNVSN